MKTCSLPEGSVIFSIKLPNMMQMQETLTGSIFDHLFFFLLSLTLSLGRFHVKSIDGSTDRCCIAIVTNERAILSGSDQPVRKLGRLRILYVRRENKRSKTATFAQWYMVHC